jgi:hypothetical protein
MGEPCQISYGGQTLAVKIKKGARQSFDWRDGKLVASKA